MRGLKKKKWGYKDLQDMGKRGRGTNRLGKALGEVGETEGKPKTPEHFEKS